MNIGEGISGAVFSDSERRYRYSLWRIWQPRGGLLLFVGLNPSTANYTKDDPTIRRLVGLAKVWGFGGLLVGNLFSLVSADPAALYLQPSPEMSGGPNDTALGQMWGMASKVMVGWGNEGRFAGLRPSTVLALLGSPVYCIRKTKVGEPIHPLYMPSSSQLIPYARGE